MRVAGVVLVLITLALGAAYWLAVEADIQHSRYATLSDARDDGLFLRGWIPDLLPPSTSNLIETHSVDTNQRCATFDFSDEEVAAFVAALESAGFRSTPDAVPGPRNFSPLRSCPFPRPFADAVVLMRRADSKSPESETFAIFRSPVETYYWGGAQSRYSCAPSCFAEPGSRGDTFKPFPVEGASSACGAAFDRAFRRDCRGAFE